MKKIAITLTIACMGIQGEVYIPTLSNVSLQSHWRIVSLFACIRRTPNVVAPRIFMYLLYCMLTFLKNINVESPVAKARNVFESATKKKAIFFPNFGPIQIQNRILRQESKIHIMELTPHNFMEVKICLGYILIYDDVKYKTINHET